MSVIRWHYLAAVVALMLANSVCAQNAQRQFGSYAMAGNVLEVQASDGKYRIVAYSDQIVETSFIPQGEQFISASEAVVMSPLSLKTQLQDSDAELELITPGITVRIQKSPFKISYWYQGKLLISEKIGYSSVGTGDQRRETITFNLDATEALYGTGARALGMNRRGNHLALYNKADYGYEEHSEQMNFSIPLVYSSKIYGIHFDNAQIGSLDLDSRHDNTLSYETIGGRKTYQVIAGHSWEELMSGYTSLTGHQPLPPRWAFGNFASRFGYHSEQQARAIVDQFIADHIPLDAIIFDLYWFGKDIKGTMGNLEFDPDNFPDPKKMIADFASKGVKTILITEPFILTTSAKWNEAVQKQVLATTADGQPYTYDFYFGHTGLIDIFDPKAQAWFWTIYKKYTLWGVAGWWGDLGEPEVHPKDMQHHTGTADQLHNVYGHNWAKLIADGYQRDFPEQRPFILMRSGYSGSQRFGMIPWSGDVNRTWGGLRSQPEIALQMGMQGMAYMHSDLGGFAGDNLDNELYLRWLQYGVFQPIFRPHSQEQVAAEPIFKDPQTKQLAKSAIELRYRLLAYNYTLAFDNNQQGIPLMRPLFFAEPDNQALYSVADSYLWGDDLLIKPVLHAGEQQSSVYFPKKSHWFDFYSEQKYLAGSTATVAVVPEHIPVFVRAGAFIPLIDVIQHTDSYSTRLFNLHYYHDATVKEGSGKLYDDNGKTPDAYQKGDYSIVYFASHFSAHKLSITLTPKNGALSRGIDRNVNVLIHHITTKPAHAWLQTGVKMQPVDFLWDGSKHILTIHIPLNKSTPAKLIVSLRGVGDD